MDSPAEQQPLRPRSALIVDDSPIIRTVLVHLFADYSVECDQAGTGADAIRRFEERLERNESYDVVCLDVHLPDMSGVAVLNRMRRLERSTPGCVKTHIVILTADDSEQVVKSMVLDGADAYYLKPFDRGSLGTHLDRLFRGRAAT